LEKEKKTEERPWKPTRTERGWCQPSKTADTSQCKTPTETSKVQWQLPIFVLVKSCRGLEKPLQCTAAGIHAETVGRQVNHAVSELLNYLLPVSRVWPPLLNPPCLSPRHEQQQKRRSQSKENATAKAATQSSVAGGGISIGTKKSERPRVTTAGLERKLASASLDSVGEE